MFTVPPESSERTCRRVDTQRGNSENPNVPLYPFKRSRSNPVWEYGMLFSNSVSSCQMITKNQNCHYYRRSMSLDDRTLWLLAWQTLSALACMSHNSDDRLQRDHLMSTAHVLCPKPAGGDIQYWHARNPRWPVSLQDWHRLIHWRIVNNLHVNLHRHFFLEQL